MISAVGHEQRDQSISIHAAEFRYGVRTIFVSVRAQRAMSFVNFGHKQYDVRAYRSRANNGLWAVQECVYTIRVNFMRAISAIGVCVCVCVDNKTGVHDCLDRNNDLCFFFSVLCVCVCVCGLWLIRKAGH